VVQEKLWSSDKFYGNFIYFSKIPFVEIKLIIPFPSLFFLAYALPLRVLVKVV